MQSERLTCSADEGNAKCSIAIVGCSCLRINKARGLLVQILALVAMEKPISMSADDIRDEKVKVLRALRTIALDDVVIGQHTKGNGIEGYLEDEGVPSDSKTPTFAAMVLHIDNDRCYLSPLLARVFHPQIVVVMTEFIF